MIIYRMKQDISEQLPRSFYLLVEKLSENHFDYTLKLAKTMRIYSLPNRFLRQTNKIPKADILTLSIYAHHYTENPSRNAPRVSYLATWLGPLTNIRTSEAVHVSCMIDAREGDLKRLDGNISAFSNRFLTNCQSSAQLCLKKLKDREF